MYPASPAVTCSPPPATLPLNTAATVTCTAIDAAGNVATGSFSLVVGECAACYATGSDKKPRQSAALPCAAHMHMRIIARSLWYVAEGEFEGSALNQVFACPRKLQHLKLHPCFV
jgi:hypothetical protein